MDNFSEISLDEKDRMYLFHRTCPIFTVEGKKAEYFSSSLLLSKDQRYFLVSAAHSLHRQESDLVYPAKNGILRSLKGNRLTIGIPGTGEPGSDTDKIDISVFDISDYYQDFSSEFQFTDFTDIVDNPNSTGLAWRIGFPGSRARNNPILKQTRLEAFIYGADIQVAEPPYDSRVNFAIPYDPERNKDLLTNQQIHYFEPRGISDSGAWLKEQGHYKLVGICIEYDRSRKTLIYTKSRYFMFLLDQFK
ncbi:MAG: hypothetical protein JNJ69_04675 [Leptospiraceae bacterium]|nr:hypothetical protein [Leptospiraceae bacterium]